MIRFQRVALPMLALALLTAARAAAPSEATAAATSPSGTIGMVAEQLGVKVTTDLEQEFDIGVEFTGSLQDPAKLARFGIAGMHVGARVTALRLSFDKVSIVADELDPPNRKSVKIGISANGGLIAPSKV